MTCKVAAYPQRYPQILMMGTCPRSFFPTFHKRALAKGWPHPKPEFGEAIQFRFHSLKMTASFRFDEDPDRTHAAQAEAGGPSAGRSIVQNHQCIQQAAGQVKRAAFSGAKFVVVVISGSFSDFDPGLAQVRNIAPSHPAAVKLLLYLEGDDDLAEQKRQQFKTAQRCR